MDGQFLGNNHVLGKAGLTGLSGAATTFSSSAITLVIRGKEYTLGAQSGAATPTTDVNTGAAFVKLVGGNSVANTPGQGCVFVFMANSAGTIGVAQGTVSPGYNQGWPLDMQGNFCEPFGAPQFPPIPAGYVPFAYAVIKAGATAGLSWIFGTNNWNATGITIAVQDLEVLPDRPQTS